MFLFEKRIGDSVFVLSTVCVKGAKFGFVT